MYNTKNKTQKVYKKNKPTLNLIPKNCVCVFPIEIVGGKTLVSNQGIMPNRKSYDKGSFLYWQEVFDGRSALKIQWQDSITLEKPEGKNYYLAKPHIGSYYYGKPISNGTEQLEISEDASYEDFMSIKASQNITLKFEYNPTDRLSSQEEIQSYFRFILVDNDIYNLYLIPELCEEKLMYISEHQEYYDDQTGLSKGCEITFSTLGDKIQKSGKAIEQYCAWNAPGEFSVRPLVNEFYNVETGDWDKEVGIDYQSYLTPKPIKYLQVEQQGPALTSCIYAIGRRQEWDEDEQCWRVGPSKFLFPCQFITTQANPLNRTSTPTKNFFCFPDEQVTMVTNAECMKWWQDQASQPLEQLKNAGMISIGTNWTNDFDNASNPIPGGSGVDRIRKDYFDNAWFPLAYDGAFLGPYDTRGCVYATDSISHSNTDTMIDIFVKNAFIYNQQPTIPLSYYSTRPLYLRDIPIIGGIANFLHLGDIKLSSFTTSIKNTSLCFFGDADVMAMCANLNGQLGTTFKEGSKMFPINFFGTNETMYQKLGVNSVNTTFCFQLTDQVIIDNTIWDTIYLGQSTYEDGTEIFPLTHQSLLANSTIKPVIPVTSNFIVDAVVVQSIFDGKIRLSCYSEEEKDFIYPEWTATILSNANWEGGNMRDWTNVFMLSNWEERFCVQQDEFTWPLAPHKDGIREGYQWDIRAQSSFTYKYGANPGVNNWQEVPGGGWQNSDKHLTTGYRAYWTCSCKKLVYEQTKLYSDFGIPSVVDKASFLQYFDSVSFNCDRSFLSLDGRAVTINDSEAQWPLYDSTTPLIYLTPLGSIRTGDPKYNWPLPVGNNDFHTVESVWVTQGTFLQALGYTITFSDTGVTLKVNDISNVGMVGDMRQSGIMGNHPCNSYKGGAGHTPERIQYVSLLNYVYFHKR